MRRGSGQIPCGPQSTGGTIDVVARPAPGAPMAEATISGGGGLSSSR
jgi:outer membrane receptor for Fe3+-dicitrate